MTIRAISVAMEQFMDTNREDYAAGKRQDDAARTTQKGHIEVADIVVGNLAIFNSSIFNSVMK